MKILLCHTHYQQPGGEDQVFADEAALLESRGHQVVRYTRHNDVIDQQHSWQTAAQTIWNWRTYRDLRRLIRFEKPAVVHCTNTFPLLSPSVYHASRAEGVPVVQSLHNYRLLCANSLLVRSGTLCEDCLGKAAPWRGVLHGCYRASRAATAVTAGMIATHRLMGTWTRTVSRYIAMSEFARAKFVAGGLAAERIAVKPNFVHPDPGSGAGRGGYAVYVGRLSAEKGIESLLDAWRRLPGRLCLYVVGDGPLGQRVKAAAAQDASLRWLGRRPYHEVLSIVGEAQCLILPSLCYENCPKTLLEAFARGTPVIASRLGAMAEIVDDGRTGRHFQPGNAADLAQRVIELTAHAERLAAMRRAARAEFESKYTADRNYQRLMEIYRQARQTATQRFVAPACGTT